MKRLHGERGQTLALFAICLVVILLGVGLVVDGGYALWQRRSSQNAADLAALAGARIVAESVGGDATNGTDANVKAGIVQAVALNGGTALTFGSPNGPQYVGSNGLPDGFVGAGSIPSGAVGVTVSTSRTWHPFFLGVAGINSWSAGAAATAMGGYAAGGPGGGLFPVAIDSSWFAGKKACDGALGSSAACTPSEITDQSGGPAFGWLKFGCTGSQYGLGQDQSGCSNSDVYLRAEIEPPPNSHGCCGAILPSDLGVDNYIGSTNGAKGNSLSKECADAGVPDTIFAVPVYDLAQSNLSAHGDYYIVGYTGFQITDCKNTGNAGVQGVWRVPLWTGPVTETQPFPGAALAVQLVQ